MNNHRFCRCCFSNHNADDTVCRGLLCHLRDNEHSFGSLRLGEGPPVAFQCSLLEPRPQGGATQEGKGHSACPSPTGSWVARTRQGQASSPGGTCWTQLRPHQLGMLTPEWPGLAWTEDREGTKGHSLSPTSPTTRRTDTRYRARFCPQVLAGSFGTCKREKQVGARLPGRSGRGGSCTGPGWPHGCEEEGVGPPRAQEVSVRRGRWLLGPCQMLPRAPLRTT